MKFIKVFANDTDYVSFRDSTGYTKPNVSLSRGSKTVYYNYPMWNANDKQFVDLGLPSGTLWATMNVGASKPSDYGQYFQWGDTQGYTKDQVGTGEGKKEFDDNDYKWYSGDDNNGYQTFKKYTTSGAKLDLEDDAAHVNMGGSWHMPTPVQIQELIDNTTTALTTSDGISGVTFTSIKDSSKSIFIPAAGRAKGGLIQSSSSSSTQDVNKYFGIWSSILSTSKINSGQAFMSYLLRTPNVRDTNRSFGLPVRGVLG